VSGPAVVGTLAPCVETALLDFVGFGLDLDLELELEVDRLHCVAAALLDFVAFDLELELDRLHVVASNLALALDLDLGGLHFVASAPDFDHQLGFVASDLGWPDVWWEKVGGGWVWRGLRHLSRFLAGPGGRRDQC